MGAVWSVGLVVARRAPGPLFRVNLIWVEVVVAAAAAVGGLFLLTGGGPQDALHTLYGVLAVAALPIAASYAGGRSDRQAAVTWLIATIVLLILVLRLFQTGG